MMMEEKLAISTGTSLDELAEYVGVFCSDIGSTLPRLPRLELGAVLAELGDDIGDYCSALVAPGAGLAYMSAASTSEGSVSYLTHLVFSGAGPTSLGDALDPAAIGVAACAVGLLGGLCLVKNAQLQSESVQQAAEWLEAESDLCSESFGPIESTDGGYGSEETITIFIIMADGTRGRREIRGLSPESRLKTLRARVERELDVPRYTAELCLRGAPFAEKDLFKSLQELCLEDGCELTCLVGRPREHECPLHGWQYIDPQGQVQGPFSLTEVHMWFTRQMLPPELPMRCDPHAVFRPLQDLFPSRHSVPFETNVKMFYR